MVFSHDTSLRIREVTFCPSKNSYEEVTIWSPDDSEFWGLVAMGMFLTDTPHESARDTLEELVVESGMLDNGPYKSAIQCSTEEIEDPRESIQDSEIEDALDQWRAQGQEEYVMDDLHEPSFYMEWNQAMGCSTYVGNSDMQKNDANVQRFTPEMIEQRDILNWMFNFHWNRMFEPWSRCRQVTAEGMIVPEIRDMLLDLVAYGDNHGVAKCCYGSVFVPKSSLKYLRGDGHPEIGTVFEGTIVFAPNKKFPWRLKTNSIGFMMYN